MQRALDDALSRGDRDAIVAAASAFGWRLSFARNPALVRWIVSNVRTPGVHLAPSLGLIHPRRDARLFVSNREFMRAIVERCAPESDDWPSAVAIKTIAERMFRYEHPLADVSIWAIRNMACDPGLVREMVRASPPLAVDVETLDALATTPDKFLVLVAVLRNNPELRGGVETHRVLLSRHYKELIRTPTFPELYVTPEHRAFLLGLHHEAATESELIAAREYYAPFYTNSFPARAVAGYLRAEFRLRPTDAYRTSERFLSYLRAENADWMMHVSRESEIGRDVVDYVTEFAWSEKQLIISRTHPAPLWLHAQRREAARTRAAVAAPAGDAATDRRAEDFAIIRKYATTENYPHDLRGFMSHAERAYGSAVIDTFGRDPDLGETRNVSVLKWILRRRPMSHEAAASALAGDRVSVFVRGMRDASEREATRQLIMDPLDEVLLARKKDEPIAPNRKPLPEVLVRYILFLVYGVNGAPPPISLLNQTPRE